MKTTSHENVLLKKWISPFIFAALGVLLVTCSQFAAMKGMVCNTQYALCTSAVCKPDPADKNKTICECKVHTGQNYGKDSCDVRQPFNDDSGIMHLLSTYSFEQYPKDKTMTCQSGNPWSYCLDKPCTVDPLNPAKAICSCEIKRSGTFVTLGGNCNKATCKDSYWSGASPTATAAAMAILTKSMDLPKQPDNFCPDE